MIISNKRYISTGIFCIVMMLLSQNVFAGNEQCYWVYFKDKKGVEFNPRTYFDAKAIERKINGNIPLNDSTDYPVNSSYIDMVSALADSITFTSRWYNAAVVWCNNPTQIDAIAKLSCVRIVEKSILIDATIASVPNNYEMDVAKDIDYDLLKNQTEHLGGTDFDKKNINGKGIRVAVFDVGFPGWDKNQVFDHVRQSGHLFMTYDFVKKSKNVFHGNAHGTMTSSCIAGNYNGTKMGLAPEVEFMLARTELSSKEPFREEEYWLAAAEWADKNGADIISSSLGYTAERYFYKDMNGHFSLVAKAATMAVRKGMLVVNSAGNEYDNSWKFIITPADVDSVLTVGGIDPKTGYHISFSSIGPNSLNQAKPNVCAFGHVLVANSKSVIEEDGTSFSCPLVAGFAACALQTKPELKGKPIELFKLIEQSANLYPYHDYAHGYGVPQASYFTESNHKETLPTFIINEENGSLNIEIKPEYLSAIDSNNKWVDLLYYHIENASGVIEDYYVIKVERTNVLTLNTGRYHPGQKLMIHYKGYTTTYNFAKQTY